MVSSRPSNSRFSGRYSRPPFRRSSNRFSRRKSKGLDISRLINNEPQEEEKQEVFTPKHLFSDFNVSSRIKENVMGKGYSEPTPIQDAAIPEILSGHNVLGLANTGTGKTAAFAIPLLEKVLQNRSKKVVVICPTRELALQINEEFKSFGKGTGLFSVLCIGGANIRTQIHFLTKPHQFIIGTPGRIKDLLFRKTLRLDNASYLVLDEVDRMLDMGFIDDIKYIVGKMPKEKQTLFFSATINSEVKGLINEFLGEHKVISVKARETAKSVSQDVIKVQSIVEKLDKLTELLNTAEFSKVLIFVKTKSGVDRLERDLIKRGVKVSTIHGDKPQSIRQRSIYNFKNNVSKVLIATDIAARGLDIPEVSHVINYDMPATYEDYVHRIGRTGRANKKGKALTFVEGFAGHRYSGRY